MILVFDLDDTLYLEHQFVRSGFWAVASYLDKDRPLGIYQSLWRIYHEQGSGRVFDRYAELVSQELEIPRLIDVYRFHQPLIRLGVESQIALAEAKSKHDTALITDGPHKMQANKFHALQLDRFISFPVYTDEHHTSKPDALPFRLVMRHYGEEKRYAYIGDNPAKDFQAPRQLGWTTIRIKHAGGLHNHLESTADHEIESLLELFQYVG